MEYRYVSLRILIFCGVNVHYVYAMVRSRWSTGASLIFIVIIIYMSQCDKRDSHPLNFADIESFIARYI